MTFREAKDELKKLARGSYHSIRYEITEDQEGELRVECWLYIDPSISTFATTWLQALTLIREKLNRTTDVSILESPGEEVGDEKNKP